MKLRSMLNPGEQRNLVGGPTKYMQGANRWELVCDLCGGTFYVDETTFTRTLSEVAGVGDCLFCCDDCEAQYEDVAH